MHAVCLFLCAFICDRSLKSCQRQLPFPNIDLSKFETGSLREVYVFEDEENPNAPIEIHFPTLNISFKEYKALGKLKLCARGPQTVWLY